MSYLGKYFVAGTLALAAHIAILKALIATFSMSAVIATSVGFCAATAINYTLQHFFVFASDQPMLSTVRRYAATTLLMLGLNAVLFTLVIEFTGLAPSLAQIITTGCTFLGNFVCNLHFTFASRLLPRSPHQ